MLKIRDELHARLNDYVVRLSDDAYASRLLVCDLQLARAPWNAFLKHFLADVPGKALTLREAVRSLAGYCRASLSNIRQLYRLRRAVGPVRSLPLGGDDPVVLDVVLYVDKTLEAGRAYTPEFPGLMEALDEQGRPYAAVVNHYGNLSPDEAERIGRMFAEDERHLLFHFQLLRWTDFVRLLLAAVLYPLALGRFLLRLDDTPEYDAVFRRESVRSIKSIVGAYARYLVARRVGRMTGRGSVVTWFENRAGDKSFRLGLRETAPSMRVIGAQLYVMPENYMGGYVSEADVRRGLAPDELHPNGPGYVVTDRVPCRPGPSLRYAYLFDAEPPVNDGGRSLLLLLPHFSSAAMDLLRILGSQPALAETQVLVRFHPSAHLEDFAPVMRDNYQVESGPIMRNFRQAAVVIGAETGSLVEALACGVPVILMNVMGREDMRYIPDLGKDEVWFETDDPARLEALYAKASRVPAEVRRKYAKEYRERYFSACGGDLLDCFGLGTRQAERD